MDLSSEGLALASFIISEVSGVPGVDTDIADFAASLFDIDDDRDEEERLQESTQQLTDMLFASTGEDESQRQGINDIAARVSARWRELLVQRKEATTELERQNAPMMPDISIPGDGGEGDSALQTRLRVKDDHASVFEVDASVRAATMAAFYRQADDGEEASWIEEGVLAAAEKGVKGKPGPPAAGAANEAPKQDFSSRMGAFDSFFADLKEESSTGMPGGKSARKKARRMNERRGGGQSDSEDEEEARRPPPTEIPASRVVEYDPMEVRMDNREFAALRDRAKREKLKEVADAEKERERDKAESARATKELARNASRLPGARAVAAAAVASAR